MCQEGMKIDFFVLFNQSNFGSHSEWMDTEISINENI